jgi:hypothetical protein
VCGCDTLRVLRMHGWVLGVCGKLRLVYVRVMNMWQAKAVLKFVDAIAEKNLRSTAVMTAARGRGKSAALGLAIASAVAFGYVIRS